MGDAFLGFQNFHRSLPRSPHLDYLVCERAGVENALVGQIKLRPCRLFPDGLGRPEARRVSQSANPRNDGRGNGTKYPARAIITFTAQLGAQKHTSIHGHRSEHVRTKHWPARGASMGGGLGPNGGRRESCSPWEQA